MQFIVPRGTVELEFGQWRSRVIDTCIAGCVARWGGCTVIEGKGYWQPPNPGGFPAVEEPIVILNVECEPSACGGRQYYGLDDFPQYVKRWFDSLATYVRKEGNQHTVYYRMFDGGEGRFVGPDTIVSPCVEDRVNAKIQATADALCKLQQSAEWLESRVRGVQQ